MKKNMTLNTVEEIAGKRDSMLSEKRTTRAMLKAPSSRTTVLRSVWVSSRKRRGVERVTHTFRR
jgi:hypothetical protein